MAAEVSCHDMSSSTRVEKFSASNRSAGSSSNRDVSFSGARSSAKVAPAPSQGGKKFGSIRPSDAPPYPEKAKSGRGHDFDGGGIGVGNGQLAQARG